MRSEKKLDVVYILSEKSSGSSFLFRSLKDALSLKNYPKTHHFESETLYWTKAASLLRKPQLNMLASEIPYDVEKARNEIKAFLDKNLAVPITFNTDEEMVFKGWYELVKQFGPVFIEKSPHHLLQWSALELILKFQQQYENQVNCHFVRIVRNPRDVFLSQFRRWNISPKDLENQWLINHMNWQRLIEVPKLSIPTITIKYEDLISDTERIVGIICDEFRLQWKFSGEESVKVSKSSKHDKFFGFQFSSSVIEVASQQGYSKKDVIEKNLYKWSVYKGYISFIYRPLRFVFRKVKRVSR